MLKSWKCNLKKLKSKEYMMLRDMCHASKNVYNCSIYNIRQHYLQQEEYLNYESNYHLMKNTDTYNYLGNVSQQTMKAADSAFKAFFALMKMFKKGQLEERPSIPRYLPKDGLYKIEFNSPRDQQKNIDKGFYVLPMSRYLNEKYNKAKIRITVPEYIRSKRMKQIHILPRHNGKYFEVCFVFEDDSEIQKLNLDPSKALSIDLGVNNFATCATSEGDSFIIDGKKIKSINQWYNKELARLSSIKDHQHMNKKWTKRQYLIARKRNRRVQDFIYKASKHIVNYCIKNDIGNIVVGYNDGFQDKANLGKVNNQNFVMIPYGQFKNRLEYLCKQVGIKFTKQEESYTSKASFWDKDEMPVWNKDNPKQGHFTGTRYNRVYKRSNGQILNADVNGALNILRKSNVVSLTALYSRGVVNTPMRIRLS